MSLHVNNSHGLFKRKGIFSFVLLFLFITEGFAQTPLQEIKGDHFVTYYVGKSDELLAQQVSRRAEEYYHEIDSQIGYSRYSEFWTWDERVKILIFPDQESFMKETGQPAWAYGVADSDVQLLHSRSILTYSQSENFLDGLLPHEIAHLVLHDFVGGAKKVPVWFDEGVAQLQEADKRGIADRFIRGLIQKGVYIPLKTLAVWDIRGEKDQNKVNLFYVQSLCVVDYMVKNFGNSAFQQLCRNLRDGKNFEEALQNAYPDTIRTLDDLEKRWVQYMSH